MLTTPMGASRYGPSGMPTSVTIRITAEWNLVTSWPTGRYDP